MNKTTSVDLEYYIKLAITMCLIFGANLLPALEPLTEYGTQIVCIFIGVIFGYVTMGMTIPSFMALISLGFTEFGNVQFVLKEAIGNSTVLYVFSILILSQLLQECGLTTKLINWIVTRNFAKNKPWVLTFLFWFTAYVAALLVNCVPPCIILWGILYDLFKKTNYKLGDKWPMVMIFGILFNATVASFISPFQIGVVANFGILSAVSNGTLTYNYVTYFLWGSVIGIILFVVWFLFAKYVIRPDVSALMAEDLFTEDKTKMTKDQKFVVVVFLAFIIGLFLPSCLADENAIRLFLNNLGSAGWGLLMVIIAIVYNQNGETIFRFDVLFAKSVIWDITMMMACVFTMSAALTDAATGIPAIVNTLITPLINSMGMVQFWIVVLALLALLANLTNTVAVSCIFIPIMYSVTLGTEFNMILFTACCNMVANICFVSPACSPNAAMMYGQKDWIPINYCLIFSIGIMVAVYLLTLCIGVPLGNIMF